MQDIADRLNISKSTVSLVLSGKSGSRVSEAVRKKVLQTAKEMNYQVNEVARSLRTGSSNLICVMVGDLSNEFFGRLTCYIQQEAKKAGYLVVTVDSNEDPVEFDKMVDVVLGKKVDGIIAVPAPGSDKSIQKILDRGVPVVTLDRRCRGLDVDYVGIDNYSATRTALDSLLAEGIRKSVSMVTLDIDVPTLNARRAAYKDAMNAHSLGKYIDERVIPYGTEDLAVISPLLKGLRNSDVVFFTSRKAFTLTLSHLAKIGMTVPESQCLLCFDDVRSFLTVHSDVRFIDQPLADMSRRAFELLYDRIKGRGITGSHLFPTRLIIGKQL